MLTSAHVRDFQSIHESALHFGKFTVICGPTSSGKSALLRSLNALAHNVNSPEPFVARGAKTFGVQLWFDDGRAALVRGKSKAVYSLGSPDAPELTEYPKSGITVPDDVRSFLRLVEVEGEDLNFAFQFDRPFLLDASATTSAKVLGDLTNVNRIFAAVREAARRRLEVQAHLKVRRADVAMLSTRAQTFRDLPAQQKAVAAAQESFQRAKALSDDESRIEVQLRVVSLATQVLSELEAMPELPKIDVGGLETQAAEIARAESLIAITEGAGNIIRSAETAIAEISEQLGQLDTAYHMKLEEAGTCPICGQVIPK